MLDELVDLMDAALGRCEYADARRVVRRTERLRVRGGVVEGVEASHSDGIGVRVRAGGGWAFASTHDPSREGARAALARALALAEAAPSSPAGPLAPAPAASGVWRAPVRIDPFALSLEERLGLLLAAEEALRTDPRIVRSEAGALSLHAEQAFASTEGSACRQERTECGGGIAAWALQDGELQRRSHPSAHDGDVALAGWEQVRALDLPGAAPRVAEEALALLSAPPCPAGERTVILDGDQLALQLHESVGHALELDRMLGAEAAYAGTSWVGVEDLGTRRYGSELLEVSADATLPGGLGSYGWDDEGVGAGRLALVEGGVLRAVLSSRESAAAIGLTESAGCMRAEGHDRQPIVRMTNVSIAPGTAGTLADLVADTDDGLLMQTNRSWSIDDRRLHFQFGCELAREIRAGELGRLYRSPTYAGVTPEFWSGLDAICSASEWRLWGLTNCGKGEPGQFAHVSHGTAPARFARVAVGAA